MQEIAVFGGTFNPIHNAHLHLLRGFSERIPFDRVILVPANVPPHKRAPHLAPAGDRLAMCRLAAREAGFEVSEIELNRRGPSYTSDTLRELSRLYPGAELNLIMGEDMFLTVQNWHESAVILKLARLCAAPRGEKRYAALLEHARFLEGLGARTFLADLEFLPISSTLVRRRAAAGEPVGDLVPEPVARYIAENHLYGGPLQ
jgi:nicotinate-nucleotide adenylyltransferase